MNLANLASIVMVLIFQEMQVLYLKKIKIKTGINVEQDKWPFPDNYFDCIYSKSLMEHLEYPQKYLYEAKRVLKPGGKICA